ncbi:uncharacterized protein LOC111498546 [Cucurbita maxima]|uniref:Uncharacterized protein LOC111498546 n=1 Tax=Cucurbita maxima TaxID=3661 RepID=A0A6J1KXV3_CUCMA|nr:uncharacterized protein LOC111498546 [Cucurbita maxima]
MKRSVSASRVSDKVLLSSPSSLSSLQSAVFRSSSVSSGLDSELYLPTYNPFSHAAEKERRRLKLAKIFIHFIPVVVVFCAVVLWFFSDPEGRGIDGEVAVMAYGKPPKDFRIRIY